MTANNSRKADSISAEERAAAASFRAEFEHNMGQGPSGLDKRSDMTASNRNRRPVRNEDIVVMIVGAVLAGAVSLAGLIFSPMIATPAAATLAFSAVVIAMSKSAEGKTPRSALLGVAAGIVLVLSFYWISAFINLE